MIQGVLKIDFEYIFTLTIKKENENIKTGASFRIVTASVKLHLSAPIALCVNTFLIAISAIHIIEN